MTTTSTTQSAHFLSKCELSEAMKPREPLELKPGRTLDRASACRQAGICGFPRLHCDRIAEFGRTLDTPRASVHRQVWRSMRSGSMVMLMGDRGHGKTHMVTLVGSEWWAFGYGLSVGAARYWRMADLFSEQKKWFDCKRDEWNNPIRQPLEVARTCGLLVLDEIQERIGTDWEHAELVRLLDVRYAESRPLILVTNRTLRDVAPIVGISAMDRMKEGGGVFECNWFNFRDRLRREVTHA